MKSAKPDPLRIKRITESIINLPTLPTIVSKMIELVDNPKTSAGSLARLISTDQALTARILKLANSAYYGFPREISTVNMAIVVLGFNAVKDTGLSLSVLDIFKEQGDTPYFDINRFWEHSIGCGIAARMLARRYHNRFAGEAFVAGLLHDIGKAVLKQYFQKEFTQIMDLISTDAADLEAAEERVIGTGHGQIGGWLAEKWNLPRIIVESIMLHHAPQNARLDPVFVSLVTVADYLCHITGTGNSGRKTPVEPSEQVWEIFRQAEVQLDKSKLNGLQTDFLLEFDRSETFVSFIHEEIK